MGRKSINTTKGGKFRNPVDQERRKDRKKELQKNKTKKQQVRVAMLNAQNPKDILEELAQLDQMQYNVLQPSPLNERVMSDKRKKLKDTLDRILRSYQRDDRSKWEMLNTKITEYETKKNQLVAFYESVRRAKEVQVEDIPLPQQYTPSTSSSIHPQTAPRQEYPVYSIATAMKLRELGQPVKEPPGCPPGPPPDIDDDGEVMEFGIENMEEEGEKPQTEIKMESSPTRQNVTDFVKETEVGVKKQESTNDDNTSNFVVHHHQMPPKMDLSPPLAHTISPPAVHSTLNIRLPPRLPLGPPPRPSLGPPLGLPLRPPVRPPVGPPPGLSRMPINTLFAQPRMNCAPNPYTGDYFNRPVLTQQKIVISAQPQVRKSSVTNLVPSALLVKREEKAAKPNVAMLARSLKEKEHRLEQQMNQQRNSKTESYEQFMEEMKDLL